MVLPSQGYEIQYNQHGTTFHCLLRNQLFMSCYALVVFFNDLLTVESLCMSNDEYMLILGIIQLW